MTEATLPRPPEAPPRRRVLIVRELGGLNHLSWVVTSYLLAITIVTPLYGKLGDLYGRKVVLQGALVLFLIGSALCGLAA